MKSSPPDPTELSTLAAFREVPRTGVIYVSVEAGKRGFGRDAEGWCNLGQGQPETGELEGAPPRLRQIPIEPSDLEYAPVPGLNALRDAIAEMYNRLFRRGMPSRYTRENVAVCGGGRVGIMRACAAIAPVHLGHFLPDYTAYEELLDVFRRFQPIPILLDPNAGYEFDSKSLHREVLGRGLGAILMSNACNPTGKLVHGDQLAAWIGIARQLGCAMLMDEFYSHYIWNAPADAPLSERIVSAARYVEDVNRDPVVIIDGLTKNWRYPGFRVSWVVGPKRVIDSVSSAGSFLDGGGSAPMQRATIDLLQHEHVLAETAAIQKTFGAKRDRLVSGLRALGVRFDREPEGTFYCWGDLSQLPPSIRDGEAFFQAALEKQVICVPGRFFDVNPGKRRLGRPSRFRNHVRFSFGPEMSVIDQALERLGEVVKEAN